MCEIICFEEPHIQDTRFYDILLLNVCFLGSSGLLWGIYNPERNALYFVISGESLARFPHNPYLASDADVFYTIEQALKNLLRYDINEGEKEYMLERSLKYFPFKMEYMGYYLDKYQSWYGDK